MEIIDKYGYLEAALDYIEKNIVSGRGLQKLAKKAGVNEDLVKNLSSALSGFSEKMFLWWCVLSCHALKGRWRRGIRGKYFLATGDLHVFWMLQ